MSFKRIVSTPSQRYQKLLELSQMSNEELRKLGRDTIRATLSYLGYSDLECGKKLQKGTVEEMFDTLLEAIKPTRLQLYIGEHGTYSWLPKAFLEPNLTATKVKQLADMVNTEITEDTDNINTRACRRTEAHKNLERQLREAGRYNDDMESHLLMFRKTLIELGKPETEERDSVTRTRKREREELLMSTNTHVEFHVTPVLKWAKEVLESPNRKPSEWKDVVIALGLFTGRRVTSELLVEGNYFELHESGMIKFVGKSKSRDGNDTVVSPTLVHPELILDSYKWLVEQGKQKPTPETSDNRFGAELRKYWKKLSTRFNVPVITDDNLRRIHGLRKIYVGVQLSREGLTFINKAHEFQVKNRVVEVLGHEREDSQVFYRLPVVFIED